MEISFYQSHWHGIDLVELANKCSHPINKMPDAKFFSLFYQTLNHKGGPSDQWLKAKEYKTMWFERQIHEYGLGNKKLLSVGAGTGVVELPLLQRNIDLELHDIQPDGFEITGVNKLTNCYADSLQDIQTKYDAIFSLGVAYALNNSQLRKLFKDVANLLKSQGIFFLLDTSLSWFEIYSNLRNNNYLKNNCLLWGKKRSLSEFYKYHNDFFELKRAFFLNSKLEEINSINFMKVPLNVTPIWQLLILKKA